MSSLPVPFSFRASDDRNSQGPEILQERPLTLCLDAANAIQTRRSHVTWTIMRFKAASNQVQHITIQPTALCSRSLL